MSTEIYTDGEFAKEIRNQIGGNKCERLIETGSFFGTGSTTIIASAMRNFGLKNAIFYTIEVNADHYRKTIETLINNKLINYVHPLWGLSIPRELLYSINKVAYRYYPTEVANEFIKETAFFCAPDDMLGQCLRAFNNRPDFVLLDSAGYIGTYEFDYVVNLLEEPCIIALDDTNDYKHKFTMKRIRKEKESFEILCEGDERFGFAICRFTGKRPPKVILGNEDQ
jgi:hypothetical protein